jgi:hypothetical protein
MPYFDPLIEPGSLWKRKPGLRSQGALEPESAHVIAVIRDDDGELWVQYTAPDGSQHDCEREDFLNWFYWT